MPNPVRAVHAFTALAVGDALGWPMEDRGNRVGGTASLKPRWAFESWERRDGGGYAPHVQPLDPGAISDDTQLALAVARSLLRGPDWWEHLTRVELPIWTVYERGGGGATKRAAQSWLSGRPPWSDDRADRRGRYFDAGGNGAAMRCLPHCLIDIPFDELATRLDLDAVVTHGHPYALIGSRVYAYALRYALGRTEPLAFGELLDRVIAGGGEWGRAPQLPDDWRHAADEHHAGYGAAWERAIDKTHALLRTAREGIQQGAIAVDRDTLEQLGVFGRERGAGHITATAAVFLASRYLTQPRQGLLQAAFSRGADTDTLAAMTGGLLGALSPEGWLQPLDQQVQDSDYVVRTAVELIDGHREPPSSPFTTRDRTKLYRFLDTARPGARTDLPLGHAKVMDITDYDSRSQYIRAWTLRTDAGQTIHIKRNDKGRDGKPRWITLSVPDEPLEAEEQRGGLVLLVDDLDRARDFYEAVADLRVTRATRGFVSFGWLAVELDVRRELPLDLAEPTRAAIRFYRSPSGVARAHAALTKRGLHADPAERAGKPLIRTRDPDGHVVEFHTLNGVSPPIQSD